MLTKEDLLKLSKERLAELLLEEWNDKEIKRIMIPVGTQEPYNDCFHGGPCTNPFHDCINCPRQFIGEWTTTSDGTVMKQDGTILHQGKE